MLRCPVHRDSHLDIAPGGISVYNGGMLALLWNILYLVFLIVSLYLNLAFTVTVAFFRVNCSGL